MPTTEQRVSAVWLGEGIATVPALLRDSGYVTGAFSASLPVNHRIIGLRDQFDHFDASLSCAQGECASELNELVLAWLRQPHAQPWFCYVHYTDVHHPYDAPPEYAARFSKTYRTLPVPDHWWMQRPRASGPTPEELEHIVAMYDAEIAYLDDQICRLLAELRSNGGERNLAIVVASDHGDEFYEHGGFSHGQSLYEELTRCPLIMVWPGRIRPGVATDEWIQNVDIVPTILELLEIPLPEDIDGESLRPYFEGRPRRRAAFSEQQGASVRSGRWKLWEDRFGALRLYDLQSDPGESANVAVAELDTLRALSATLERWKGGLEPPPVAAERPDAPTLDPVTEERMRALGYLE
jgi:arylsulfatase A-like enzyme